MKWLRRRKHIIRIDAILFIVYDRTFIHKHFEILYKNVFVMIFYALYTIHAHVYYYYNSDFSFPLTRLNWIQKRICVVYYALMMMMMVYVCVPFFIFDIWSSRCVLCYCSFTISSFSIGLLISCNVCVRLKTDQRICFSCYRKNDSNNFSCEWSVKIRKKRKKNS